MALEAARKCACGSDQPASIKALKYSPIESPAKALMSTKRVCFVRHGQGAHNRTIMNWGMVDPELTSEGEAQVADLHERLTRSVDFSEVQLIATSPLTRDADGHRRFCGVQRAVRGAADAARAPRSAV